MSSSPDIIKDASDALKPISDRKIIVMQGWYDKNIHDKHVTLILLLAVPVAGIIAIVFGVACVVIGLKYRKVAKERRANE